MCFCVLYMLVSTVYVMFALYSYCDQKLLYADFANKRYHIIICTTFLLLIYISSKFSFQFNVCLFACVEV